MQSLGKSFPDCSLCRLPKYKAERSRWGCDKPTERVVFKMGCECGGDVDCARCAGAGVVDQRRCPSSLISTGDRADVLRVGTFLRTYAEYDSRNVLPSPGGFGDQAASWCAAVSIADAERARWERLRQDQQYKDARRSAS